MIKRKKLMMLGGLRYLLPVIEAAHQEGYYVITCDYLPDNIAHKYSDEYVNLSIIDKEAVLKKARELEIDGIISFAVDPGVITAAYVAEKMNLPFAGSYESVRILQNKDLFRKFLSENDFNVPVAGAYTNYEDAAKDISRFTLPVIVKPTDSAGSKGVSRIDALEDLPAAFALAKANSISGKVIIEEFIEKEGCSSDSDCFSVDGELKIVTYSAQRFDENACNPYTPSAFSWPSTFSKEQETYLTQELQRLINLLGLKTSIYNIETRIGKNGKPYIMEVSPRGGGNRLAEMVRYGTGVDMIRAYIQSAVGDSIEELSTANFKGNWAEIILHSDNEGIFEDLSISSEYTSYVVQKDLWVKKGDFIKGFNSANDNIGSLIMLFPDSDILEAAMTTIPEWCKINVR